MFSMRSRACLLDSTNSVSKRPTACFSGGGGITTPGLLLCNEVYSQRKSRYLRDTANSGCLYALDVVCPGQSWIASVVPRSYLRPDLVDNVTACEIANLVRISDQDIKGWLRGLFYTQARRSLAYTALSRPWALDGWGTPRPDRQCIAIVSSCGKWSSSADLSRTRLFPWRGRRLVRLWWCRGRSRVGSS